MLFQVCQECGALHENLEPIIVIQEGKKITKNVCTECAKRNKDNNTHNILLG
ncbi:hypothetical protein GW796_05825 [archaeon]|nr:hypothetical protein [archaeon]NCQ51403.1 hypothetical protein [archaeon]NCT58771.1 hypothetical protein [archaeon]